MSFQFFNLNNISSKISRRFSRYDSGLTLVELMIAMAVIALIATLATPYLLGQREKRLLMVERDKLVNVLKEAQNKSMVAEDGYDYGVLAENTDADPEVEKYSICRDSLTDCPIGKVYLVDEKIKITWDPPPPPINQVNFDKLTGAVSDTISIQVRSGSGFYSVITIEPQGVIEVSPPQK